MGLQHGRTMLAGHVRSIRRLFMMLLVALVVIAGAGWLVPPDVAAGEAATIVTDGAPLFVDHDDLTVVEWMEAGTRVDLFFGPYNWMYQVRYYDQVGWTWSENVAPEGSSGVPAVGGSALTSDGGPVAVEQPAAERWIDINRSSGAVTLYEGWNAQYIFWGSLSKDASDGFYATAAGTYYVYTKHIPLTYTPYADNYITHWVGFDSYRRNGFHSWTKDANGNLASNGAGYTAGCVALRPGEIEILYKFASVGMRVEVHW